MTVLRVLAARLRSLAGRDRSTADLDDDIAAHLDLLTQEHLDRGLSPAAARAAARRAFGGINLTRAAYEQQRALPFVETLVNDVRYAWRMFRRRPGFALAAILSLALAIGANTLAFSVVNGLLLRPLPIAAPEQIVTVQSSPAGGVAHSFPNYRDFRDRNEVFSGLAGFRVAPMNLEAAGPAARVWGYLATGNYFDVLGVTPAAGRFFTQEDDMQPGGSPLVVLGYDSWQSRFGGDQNIVGRTIRINGLPYTIVGVAPRGFHGTELYYRPELWVPMAMQAQVEARSSWLESRQTHNTWIVGRLRPDVTIARAEANMNAIAADLVRAYPGPNHDLHVRLTAAGLIGDSLRTPVKAFTLGLLALAGLVLLAGCVNLAGILLAHGTDRERELAMRVSLGAGRGHIVRQLLTEALLLASIGGLVSAALAAGAAAALSAWQVPLALPIQFDVRADWRVLLFGVGVSLAAGIACGLAPARQASRVDPNAVLRGSADAPLQSGRRWALRDGLVTIQVALCVVLLSACLLSVQGLREALAMPTGFEPDGVAVASVNLGPAGYSATDGRHFQTRVLDAVAALPGVTSAAFGNSVPLHIDQSSTTVSSALAPRDPSSSVPGVSIYQVSPGYFRALGTRLMAGRDFSEHDREGAPRVAVVNETFVRRVLQTSEPIGARFRYGQSDDLVEVIGVVEDGKYTTLTESPRPAVFQAMLQHYNSTTMIIARSSRPADDVAGDIRRLVAALDSGLAVYDVGSLRQLIGFAWLPNQAAAVVLTVYGVLALILAATGIHGLAAYSVAKRYKEIGIRLAVGASRADVARLVLGRAAATAALGAAVGVGVALAAAPLLASIVYQASPRDPAVIAGVAAILGALGVLSCWAPLYRSLHIDPMAAVRSD